MGKHILVISQYFYPEEFRINDICEEWVKRGHEVTVVTGIPNYPQGKFFDGYGWRKKRKEIYKGIHIIRLPIIPRGERAVTLMLNYFSFVVSGFFWKAFTRVRADKVFIFEVSPMTQALTGVWYARKRKIPCYIYVQDLWPENVEFVTGIHNRRIIGAIDKMVNYIYRNCTGIFATSPSFVKKIEERDSAWETEAGAGEPGIGEQGKRRRSKVAYWPQYAEEFYRPVKTTFGEHMERESVKNPLEKDSIEDNPAGKHIGEESMESSTEKRIGKDSEESPTGKHMGRESEKSLTRKRIENGSMEDSTGKHIGNDSIDSTGEKRSGQTEKKSLAKAGEDSCFQVVFTGNIGYAQGLDILPATAEILKRKGINCRFLIVGDGRYREELEREIASRNVVDMFRMPGRKLPREIPSILAEGDVAYISFANNPLFENTIPAKLQSYMACGIPILASATGETKRIIDQAGCGMTCGMGDCQALAEGIERFMEMPEEERIQMGRNAWEYSGEHFDKKRLMDEMEGYLSNSWDGMF